MDNPVLSLLHQEDFSELLASYGGGAGNGDRLPLVVYRVYPETGREEMIRGSRIIGLNTRALRNLAGIGNDNFVYNYMQSQNNGFAGTALGRLARRKLGYQLRWWRRRCCSTNWKCAERAEKPSGSRSC